jgi:hypothetical protein
MLEPAKVTDRRDPQLVHLDGLKLSRAWCLRGITVALPKGAAARRGSVDSAARHAAAALPYVGEHWLASFAVSPLPTAPPD